MIRVIAWKAPTKSLVADACRRMVRQLEPYRPGKQRYLCIMSGRSTDYRLMREMRFAGIPINSISATTSENEIRTEYELAIQNNQDLCIFTTYKSASRIRGARIKTDLEINDEAHNLCEDIRDDRLSQNVDVYDIGSGPKLNLTCTPVFSSDPSQSMDSLRWRWGNRIEHKPKEAINGGRIAMPRLMWLIRERTESLDDRYVAYPSAIINGFKELGKFLGENSHKPAEIGAKLLVCVPKIEHVNYIRQHPDIRSLIDDGVTIITIDSRNGAWINRVTYAEKGAKDAVSNCLATMKLTDRVIVIQVDMITEGIDIVTLNGGLILGEINQRRLVQFIGRSLRLIPEDRENIRSGAIPLGIQHNTLPSKHRRIKPFGLIMIPIFGETDFSAGRAFRSTLLKFADEYGLPPLEYTLCDNYGKGSVREENHLIEALEQLYKAIQDGKISDIHEVLAISLLRAIGNDRSLAETLLTRLELPNEWIDYLDCLAVLDSEEAYIELLRNQGQGVFADSIKSKFGTIYTPESIVTMTVDLAFKHLDKSLDRTTLKYCDPAAGDGNFLAVLYRRLMADEQFVSKFPDPICRSRHIITKNLWGFEILKNMWLACRIRLLILHAETVKKADKERLSGELTGLVDGLHIYHGNTVKSSKDDVAWEWTDKEGTKHTSPDLKIGEGDLLPEELRAMKFDMITGNPPYTHLRNVGNRRYCDYPNQRDLAQVFVRWSLDHLTEKGVCSLNTTDAWLNVKTSDGAAETRGLVDGRIRGIMNSEEIALYSESDGGNMPTFLICLSRTTSERTYVLNDHQVAYDTTDLTRHNFIPNVVAEYHHVRLGNKYTPMSLNRGKSVAETNQWIRGCISVSGDYHNYVILAPRHLGSRIPGAKFKLCRRNPQTLPLSGEWKYCEITDVSAAHWLFGCLNTKTVLGVLTRCVRQVSTNGNNRMNGDWIVKIDNRKFAELPIPDFDWYLANRPQQHADFLKWVETNVSDKDVFLNGVDEQFSKLIGQVQHDS